jgi:cell wall-associated NlpC family hydrolase
LQLLGQNIELEVKMNHLGDLVVKQARTWLGTKYHHQGRLKKSVNCAGGVDCIGLVIGIINELNICDNQGYLLSKYDRTDYSNSPQTTKLAECFSSCLDSIDITEIIPGDILLFKFWQEPQHVGIVSNYPTGGLGLIHCNSSSGSLVEQPLNNNWIRMITHAYRFRNLKPTK